jgi:hypothetical protein
MQPVKLLNVLLIILLTMSVASCGIVPLWVSVTHTIGDVILTKETGKSSYEHVASTITGKDCKFTRILKDKKICMSEKEYKDYLLSLNCDTYKWDILGNVSCEKKGK